MNLNLKLTVAFSTAAWLLTAVPPLQAATMTVFNSATAWNSQIDPLTLNANGFENAPISFISRIGSGSSASVVIGNASFAVDRATDSISRVLEMQPGAYAPTGVLSSQNAANLELSNILITPLTPMPAFSLLHAAWRGSQVRFVIDFADSTQQTFLANTVGQTTAVAAGMAPMAFTGVISDTLITRIRIETTVAANDVFGRGLNIDAFSTADTASAVPEPASSGLAGLALVAAGVWGRRRHR